MFSHSSVRVHHHKYLQELANLNEESLTTLLHASRCFLKSFSAGQIFATALVSLMKFEMVYCVFMNTISPMKHSSQCVLILPVNVYLNLLSLWFLLRLCLFYFSFLEYNTFLNQLKRCHGQKKENSVFSQRTDEASATQYFQVIKLP